MLNAGGRTWPPKYKSTLWSWVSFSEDGTNWTKPKRITEDGIWLWRVTWYKGKAYGVGYETVKNAPRRTYRSHLYASPDGRSFERVVSFEGFPGRTEATLRFDEKGTCYCVHRRDGASRSALLGRSRPPYKKWEWRDTGFYFGGPDFVRYAGRWWAAGRRIVGPAVTVLAEVDFDRGTLEPVLYLPSGGDTSYPGLVLYNGELWISYYSSHEGKTSIYLARVAFE